MLRRAFIALSFVSAVGCAGGAEMPDESSGPSELRVGFYENEEFSELLDGDPCYLGVQGQGGVWIMPSMRAANIPQSAIVGCTVEDLTTDSLLGDAELERKFSEVDAEGWREISVFLLPVLINPLDLPTIDLHEGQLTCHVADTETDDLLTTKQINVVLTVIGGETTTDFFLPELPTQRLLAEDEAL